MRAETMRWAGDRLYILDQTRLPAEKTEIEATDPETVAEAIKRLAVRGAPAIGVAAAYGVALAALRTDRGSPAGGAATDSRAEFEREVSSAIDLLASTRPTAVNLFWALERMRKVLASGGGGAELAAEAEAIHADDIKRCERLGDYGSALLPDDATIITHCNAGALATGGIGTALAVVYKAIEAGKRVRVLADETRPLLQGARITAWELAEAGVEVIVMPDGAAAHRLSLGGIDAVITGADRIAANGDSANKIGTYSLALAAAAHEVPFYIVAPLSTVDLDTPSGEEIVIEERDPGEVTNSFGTRTVPEGVGVFNPAFDVTPARLIRAIVTDRGVVEPPFSARLARLVSDERETSPGA